MEQIVSLKRKNARSGKAVRCGYAGRKENGRNLEIPIGFLKNFVTTGLDLLASSMAPERLFAGRNRMCETSAFSGWRPVFRIGEEKKMPLRLYFSKSSAENVKKSERKPARTGHAASIGERPENGQKGMKKVPKRGKKLPS